MNDLHKVMILLWSGCLKVNTKSKGPRTIMLLVYVGAGDSSKNCRSLCGQSV